MRGAKYYLYFTVEEKSQIIHSLVERKNKLLAEGRCTDAVDEIICKVSLARQRKVKIKYV